MGVRWFGSLLAAVTCAAIGSLTLVAPIFGIAIAAVAPSGVIGFILAPAVATADKRTSAVLLGVLLGVLASLFGALLFVSAGVLTSSDPEPRSAAGVILFVVIASLSLAVIAAPIGAIVGAAWGAVVRRVVATRSGLQPQR